MNSRLESHDKIKATGALLNLGTGPGLDGLIQQVQKHFDLVNIQYPTQKPSEVVSSGHFHWIFVVIGKSGRYDFLDDFSTPKMSGVRPVFFLEFPTEEIVAELLNTFDPIAIFTSETDLRELDEVLVQLTQGIESHLKHRETLNKVKLQNRQLETLTKDLEALVRERTQDIEVSKNQIELKVRKVKQLVSFVKSLSSVRRIEDLLFIIREEIRKAYGPGEAYLACDTGESGPWILHFQRGDVATVKTSTRWETGIRLRINEIRDQQYLANTFSRPFGRVVAFPLQSKGVDSRDVVLFVEHQIPAGQIDLFIDYMGERLQSLSLALDRSLLEVNLKRASFLWESTFDSIDDPIAIFGSDHQVIRSNKAYVDMISERSVEEESRNSLAIELIDLCISHRSSTGQSMKIGQRFFDAHCYPIIFHKEEPISSVVIHYVDVTNYKNLQSTMIQNEKMSAVGHLAGNIAHELNNPLTGIRSLCQVLIEENKDGDAQVLEDLKEVEEAANRSQKIINNLLSFSQTAVDSEMKLVDLNQLLKSTLPLLKSVTSEYAQHIELSEENLPVLVEPHLTQQVIFNLINNACQAMGNQPGDLRVTTRKSHDRAEFSVTDTGPGVSENLGSGVFDPFVTTKSEAGGTGLGLSMSQTVIRKMGGDIGFDSKAGAGATFWFWLPLNESGDTK